MSRLTQKGQGAPFNLFQTVSEAVAPAPFSASTTLAGQRFDSSDGREFVIVQNGTTALAAGRLVQAPAIVGNHQNVTVATTTAGARQITVTLGATAATANQYAGGFLVLNAGTGAGQTLRIDSHPAANASATLVLTLSDALVTTTAVADTKGCLIPSLYNGVVINPTTPTNTPVGATLYPVAASVAGTTNVFGFIQTKGPVSLLADGTIAVGAAISPSNAVAGAVESGVIAQGFVGRALQAGVDTESRTVYIDL